MIERYWTVAEVAELTRSSESTVRYWYRIGIGPEAIRIGRRLLFKESAVLQWLSDHGHSDGAS